MYKTNLRSIAKCLVLLVLVGLDKATDLGDWVSIYENSTSLEERMSITNALCNSSLTTTNQTTCRNNVLNIFTETFAKVYAKSLKGLETETQRQANELATDQADEDHLKIMATLRRKVHILREMLSNARGTKTINICETGFLAGRSSLLWLLFDGRIQLTSFSENRNPYLPVAAQYLEKKFRDRFKLIVGESIVTIPRFRKSNPDFRCDLFFVNGSHDFGAAASDLANALALSYLIEDPMPEKRSYVIINGMSFPSVREAWEGAKLLGYVREVELIEGTEAMPLAMTYGIVQRKNVRSIRSMFLSAGALFSYPIMINQRHKQMCLKVDNNLQAQTRTYFARQNFDKLAIEYNSKAAAIDVKSYIAGYPLRNVKDSLLQTKHRSVGCPNPVHKAQNVRETETTFAVAAQFRNEAMIMKEWLDHYLDEGCSHFYLINNNSTDDFLIVLAPYIQKGVVTLFSNPSKHNQITHLNRYVLPFAHLHKFLIPVDLDEFIYSRKNYGSVKEYLDGLPDCVDAIVLPGKAFGSNGNDKQPKSVIHTCTKRRHSNYQKYTNPSFGESSKILLLINSKQIVRSRSLKYLSLHRHTLIEKDNILIIDPSGEMELSAANYHNLEGHDQKIALEVNLQNGSLKNLQRSQHLSRFGFSNCAALISEEELDRHELHFNHYPHQSKEFYFSVKLPRGDADATENDNARNLERFHQDEKIFNQVEDDELSKKKLKKE